MQSDQGCYGIPRLPKNIIRVTTGNGYGSTNTVIRRFSVILEQKGAAVTYQDDAAFGASFKVNEPGIYAILYYDQRNNSGAQVGISLNSSQLSTSILSINNFDILASSENSTYGCPCIYIGPLERNDIIRPHTDANPNISTNEVRFTMSKIGVF